MLIPSLRVVAAAIVLLAASPALAAERASTPVPSRLPVVKQQQAPRAACTSPDGPQPDGAIRCEMCPAAPGARVMYRPYQCSNGKWIEAGPCADGDCAGRTY